MLSLRPMRPPWEELEPASKSAVERNRHAARRVEQFATAIFAVAMALPVLRLIDHATASIEPDSSLTQAIQATWPASGACAAALLVLLTCWFLHHLMFHYLTRSSGPLLLLHAALLPAVLFVPFSAALLNTLTLTRQAVLLFEGNAILLQLLLVLAWRHAVKGGLLFGSDVPRRVVVRVRLLLIAGAASLGLVAGLALINSTLSLLALAAVLTAQMALIARGGYALDLRTPASRASSGF